MRHTKRKLIILISSLSLMVCVGVVLAAFLFSRTIDGDGRTGNIYEIQKNILNYSAHPLNISDETDDLYNDPKNAYKAVLQNGLDVLKDRTTEPVVITDNTIECYATERSTVIDEPSYYGYPYLNQLGFEVDFITTIDSYIRISFEDVWISYKHYANGISEESIIVKDQLNGKYEQLPSTSVNNQNFKAYYTITESDATIYSSSDIYYTKDAETGTYNYAIVNSQSELDAGIVDGNQKYKILSVVKPSAYSNALTYYKFSAESPFAQINNEKVTINDVELSDKWYYDAGTNVAYLTEMINVEENPYSKNHQTTVNDNKKAHFNFKFNLANNYFYKTKVGTYDEIVKITLSYHVEAVQANRAMEKWGIEPEYLV